MKIRSTLLIVSFLVLFFLHCYTCTSSPLPKAFAYKYSAKNEFFQSQKQAFTASKQKSRALTPLRSSFKDLSTAVRQVETLEIPLGGRPDSFFPDLPQGTIGRDAVALARHHIVPLNALRAFWNSLIASPSALRIRSIPMVNAIFQNIPRYRAGPQLALLLGDILPQQLSVAQDVFEAWFRTNTNPAGNPEISRVSLRDAWASTFVWLPGNLFIGPRDRQDDPGEGFEARSAPIVDNGNAPLKHAEYLILFNKMTEFTQQPTAALLDQILPRLIKIAGSTDTIALDARRWTKAGQQWRIR